MNKDQGGGVTKEERTSVASRAWGQAKPRRRASTRQHVPAPTILPTRPRDPGRPHVIRCPLLLLRACMHACPPTSCLPTRLASYLLDSSVRRSLSPYFFSSSSRHFELSLYSPTPCQRESTFALVPDDFQHMELAASWLL
jgi:hypothetical protein